MRSSLRVTLTVAFEVRGNPDDLDDAVTYAVPRAQRRCAGEIFGVGQDQWAGHLHGYSWDAAGGQLPVDAAEVVLIVRAEQGEEPSGGGIGRSGGTCHHELGRP
jgi:hypothetical protein